MKLSTRKLLTVISAALAASVVLAAAIAATTMCLNPAPENQDHQASSERHMHVLGVTRALAQRQTWPIELTCSGTIVAWQEAIISAETDGLRITSLHADLGSRVRRGQVLAELARDALEADLRRYEAALASAKATLLQAKSNAERARSLQNSGAISEQQINDYLTAEQTAYAAVDLADAQIKVQQVMLSQTTIRAVDDGLITSRSALLGQVVSKGTELFRLQRQGKVEWRAEVDAKQLPQIEQGAAATVYIPGGRILDGTVRLVSPILSDSTARANVFVRLPESVTPGDFLTGRIRAGEQAVLAVPISAIVFRDGYSYVFELGAKNRVTRRQVTLGQQRGSQITVLSGIPERAAIVANGGAFLADGDIVKVVEEQT